MSTITVTFQSTNCDNIGILGEGTLMAHQTEEATIEYAINLFNRMPGSDKNFKVSETSTYGKVTDEHPLGITNKSTIAGTIRNEAGLFDYWVDVTATA